MIDFLEQRYLLNYFIFRNAKPHIHNISLCTKVLQGKFPLVIVTRRLKRSVSLKRATQVVPTLNASPLLGTNHYSLCLKDFLEVAEKKGQYKTTSMEVASMYLQLTDLEAA